MRHYAAYVQDEAGETPGVFRNLEIYVCEDAPGLLASSVKEPQALGQPTGRTVRCNVPPTTPLAASPGEVWVDVFEGECTRRRWCGGCTTWRYRGLAVAGPCQVP